MNGRQLEAVFIHAYTVKKFSCMSQTNVMDFSHLMNSKWPLLGVALLTFFTPILGAPVDCEDGFYYDKITGKCDPCEDICFKAIQQGTLAKCRQLCPDYTVGTTLSPARSCPKYFYYDVSVDRCEPCKTLCTGANSRGQEAECHSKCPDWPTNDPSKRKSVPESTTSQSVVHDKVNGPDIQGTLPIWVPLVIGVLICVCIVLMCCFRKDIIYRIKNLCFCSFHRQHRRPQQVVTNESTYGYEPVGIGRCPPPMPLETRV